MSTAFEPSGDARILNTVYENKTSIKSLSTRQSLPIMLFAFFIGCRIRFTVGGKTQIIEQESAKTKSSMRTLPLVGRFKEYFAEVKVAQELNKQVCGNCYNYEYDGFVFVDELGERMKPDYLTSQFPAFIQRHGMKKMRFHDLRHSCASLLLANGVPLKQIQDWLGHSDFFTTANIYAHLDYSSKLSSAQAMVSGMPLPEAGDFGSRWEQNAEKSGE